MSLIVKKARNGLGAFLVTAVGKGDLIVDWSSHPLFEQPPRILPKWRFDQISPGVFVGPVGPEKYPDAYINHSCRPNAEVRVERPTIHLVALRDLDAGLEVTFDYAAAYPGAWAMKCRCGEDSCRGVIRGKN